jgi:hypothetical protein
MPRSNFYDVLKLPAKGPVKVSGPIPAGEQLKWIWVWVFQNHPDQVAARGYGGAFNGPKWEVNLQMAPGSPPFKAGRPALGSALALIDDGGGEEEVYWWSEALRVRKAPT